MTHWTESVYRENAEIFRPHLEAELDNAGAEVTDLLELLADHGIDPESALDVPCGIGRHSVELAERGVDVRGIDISESYLDRARELAAERGVADSVSFEHGDMREFGAAERTYDLVLNAWTSFGYYDDDTEREILRAFRERTADDGALVLELVNRVGVLGDFQSASVPEDDERLVVETHEYDPETARMRTEREGFAATDDGYEYEGEMTYEVRLYAPVELAARCRDAGFGDVSLYAGLDGEPLDRESTRLTVVAEP